MVGQGQQPSSNQQWVLGLAQGDLADSRVRLVEFLAGRAHSYHLTPRRNKLARPVCQETIRLCYAGPVGC